MFYKKHSAIQCLFKYHALDYPILYVENFSQTIQTVGKYIQHLGGDAQLIKYPENSKPTADGINHMIPVGSFQSNMHAYYYFLIKYYINHGLNLQYPANCIRKFFRKHDFQLNFIDKTKFDHLNFIYIIHLNKYLDRYQKDENFRKLYIKTYQNDDNLNPLFEFMETEGAKKDLEMRNSTILYDIFPPGFRYVSSKKNKNIILEVRF